MENEKNAISVDTLKKILEKSVKVHEVKLNIDDTEITLEIKPVLSMEDGLSFVNNIVENCIGKDYYYPDMVDFLIKTNLLTYYTNFSMPEELKEQYEIIWGLPEMVYQAIHDNINEEQYAALLNGIYAKISYEENKLNKKTKLDELFEKIISVVDNLDTSIDYKSVSEILSKLSAVELNEKTLVETIVETSKKKDNNASDNVIPLTNLETTSDEI